MMAINTKTSFNLVSEAAKFFTTLCLLAICTCLLAAPAQAALISAATPVCSHSDVTPDTGSVLACSGAWEGNDANQLADVEAQLATDAGFGPWGFVHKVNANASSAILQTVPASTSDTLTFNFPITGKFAVSLKASNQFSLYVLDGGVTGITTIDFVTDGTSVNKQGNPQGLSHVSLFAPVGLDPFSVPVPEPSAVLLLSACAAWWTVRRR